MPILDCQIRVEENEIQYKFFKKPMATPLVMMQSIASECEEEFSDPGGHQEAQKQKEISTLGGQG